MDPVEIAHSITIEAIRAGLNRPEEIKDLFKTVIEQARGISEVPPPAPAAEDEDEEIRPQPEVATEEIRSQPDIAAEEIRPEAVVEPQPEVAEPAPRPSVARREPASREQEEPVLAHLSAEDIAASHGEDFIKCLECGQTKQQIKGHLRQMHQMSVEDYKKKWGLPDEYPVVAPATRRRFQERARINYQKNRETGTGLAAKPGPRKPKEQQAA